VSKLEQLTEKLGFLRTINRRQLELFEEMYDVLVNGDSEDTHQVSGAENHEGGKRTETLRRTHESKAPTR